MYCSNFEGEPWIIIYLVKSSRKLLWCYLSFQQMFWNVLIKLHISNTSLTEYAKLWIKLGKSNKLPTIVYNLWYAVTSKNEFYKNNLSLSLPILLLIILQIWCTWQVWSLLNGHVMEFLWTNDYYFSHIFQIRSGIHSLTYFILPFKHQPH